MEESGTVLGAESVGDADSDVLGLLGRRDFRLLIVDDSAGLREEIRRLAMRLGVFTEMREAENGIDAFKKVMASPPDLIMCDLVMPTVDGLKFLSLLYARPEFREIPVIMLTGKTDVESKIKGLEQGASDYVTKPFDAGELLARMKVQLKIKALQDQLKETNSKLWELSTIDPLTSLYNRRYFMESLESEFSRAVRYDTPLSFIMLDIDFFKKLNDNYGHQAGDDVLKRVGEIIKFTVRDSDVPGRYGGEEFCVILPHAEEAGGMQLAERLHEAIRAEKIPTCSGELQVTVSLGVSCVNSEVIETVEDLVRVADEALYKAKEAGRDRVEMGSC